MRAPFISTLLSMSLYARTQISAMTLDRRATSCRNVPGDPGFPSTTDFGVLNATVSGRLVKVVPFAEFCVQLGGCTANQSASSVFRDEVPGAINQVNWEQDYDSTPPSLCELQSPLTCGQGDVPLFGILAESAADIQAGINFSVTHNLRVAIKASGHDYLGRSTAKNSLLISTHKLQNSTFHDNFVVGGESLGPAVTLGSGIPLSMMYNLTKAQGRIAVGGTASTVVAAGGYVQGGGHSALAPTFGLAADNCLEIDVVLANGDLIKANTQENSDLFWAMRGGGAGSWGVMVSATFRTFPTFNAVNSLITITSSTNDEMSQVAAVHAQHIFDWDALRAGQYFSLFTSNISQATGNGSATMTINTFFPNATVDQATTALQPFINDVQEIVGVSLTQSAVAANINDLLFSSDDSVGMDFVLGSRLVPATAYKNSTLVGQVYSELLKGGAQVILGLLVAGGQVAANANVSNAVTPAWRTAKTHMIIANVWNDTATIDQVHGNQTLFMKQQLPILEKLAGPGAGAYSNEANPFEVDFQTVFFGPNYPKLSAIKAKYDPADLFIVRAGVGSERWDADGLCRV